MDARLSFHGPERSSGIRLGAQLPPQQPFPHAALSHGQHAGVQTQAAFTPLQVHEQAAPVIEHDFMACRSPALAPEPKEVRPTTKAAAPTTNALIIVRIVVSPKSCFDSIATGRPIGTSWTIAA